MINTILFDMGGTLEDIWYNDQTIHSVTGELRTFLNEHDLGTGCNDITFWNKLNSGIRTYKQWSESNELEKNRRKSGRSIIWRTSIWTVKTAGGSGTAGRHVGSDLLSPRASSEGQGDSGGTEKTRVSSGVISNTASLYSVFDVLEQYGIR